MTWGNMWWSLFWWSSRSDSCRDFWWRTAAWSRPTTRASPNTISRTEISALRRKWTRRSGNPWRDWAFICMSFFTGNSRWRTEARCASFKTETGWTSYASWRESFPKGPGRSPWTGCTRTTTDWKWATRSGLLRQTGSRIKVRTPGLLPGLWLSRTTAPCSPTTTTRCLTRWNSEWRCARRRNLASIPQIRSATITPGNTTIRRRRRKKRTTGARIW